MSTQEKSKPAVKKAAKRNPYRTSTAEARRHILNKDTKFVITEAYKSARTNIMFALSTSPSKVITVTSSNPAEAKTTTAVNLAITFAMTGAKVLLIDGDMRKPFVHKLFERLDRKTGLSSVLGGMCTVAEAIRSNIRDNLDIVPAGPTPPNPAELLGSENMKKFIEVLSGHYDYIFIDMPPVNVVSDALLLTPVSAGMIFVIRDNYTRHGDVQNALSQIELAQGKVLGFIKTACRSKSTGGYYGKGYKYGYKYGNKYGYNYSYGNNSQED